MSRRVYCVAVVVILAGAVAGCGPWTCEKHDATLGNCRAEWVCGGDTYVAVCPPSKGSDDTAVNPECVCQKNGETVGPLGDSSQDWCNAADRTEKASWANGHCGWDLPLN